MLLKTLILSAILALTTNFFAVDARPTGAPFCAATEEKLTAAMGAPTGDRSFRIETSSPDFTPGQPMTIKITSANPNMKTYKGLLLYVMPAADNQKRVGKFVIPANHKSNVPNCGAIQAEPDSVITHMSPADKPLGAEIMWTAPANFDGDLIVRAAVVGTGPSNWQILANVPLKKRAATGEAPAMYGGPIKRKCKKYRKKMGYGTPAMGGPQDMKPGYGAPAMGGGQGMMPGAPAMGGGQGMMPGYGAPATGGASGAGGYGSGGSQGPTGSENNTAPPNSPTPVADAPTDGATSADGAPPAPDASAGGDQAPAGSVDQNSTTTAGAISGVSISVASSLGALAFAVAALAL